MRFRLDSRKLTCLIRAPRAYLEAVPLWSGGSSLHALVECSAYTSLQAKNGSDLGFQGTACPIVTDAPELAWANFLRKILGD